MKRSREREREIREGDRKEQDDGADKITPMMDYVKKKETGKDEGEEKDDGADEMTPLRNNSIRTEAGLGNDEGKKDDRGGGVVFGGLCLFLYQVHTQNLK